MFVLDTDVVSELRKVEAGKGHRQVAAWSEQVTVGETFLAAISVYELEHGVLLLERKDKRQGSILRAWMDTRVLPEFEGRILPIDVAVAQRCAKLHVPDPKPMRDALIAATALVHGMTVVTGNGRDFEPMGVETLNPWKWKEP
ncbi:MAG TPA: type II toxin-antitoxin system VapC family toxin [Steroidobacteraceae bacterium]|nr:type II toxin-antitoxin system VapC family toxin [Steroidobacteraceae bacterium]